MSPRWLVALSWVSLAVGFASAAWILSDVCLRGRRQWMPVMEAVWPLTALYSGPLGLWAYRRFGEAGMIAQPRARMLPRRPAWSGVAVSVMHCGAGCVLGDIIGEFVLFGLGASIAGQVLYAEYVGDYVLAICFGIVFQYLVISRMGRLTGRKGLVAAAKSDFVALSAFEVGLFGWMALMRFVFFPGPRLYPDSPVYWLFMQIGMLLGFATSWPANAWLIRRGIKEAM